ncbi:restriction endonuclease [Ectobacillus antri]|uniref:restriction endonuclease n=1 Tax=Ectobacillus antri TaxID=2486280 RepID=UPI000F5B7FAB|nr:restriction endonuclease [Ectobacillus antri]
MSIMTYIVLLALLFVAYKIWSRRKDGQLYRMYLQFNRSEDYRKTLAMGIYYRFKKAVENETVSRVFIRQNPLQFETFCADLLERVYGGSCTVTTASGDYGVDFEHRVNGELWLGQCKVYCGDMPFNAIALIHSNMVKRGAAGGYIITTGSYTEPARAYAAGLNIKLLSGPDIADLYMQSFDHETAPVYEKSLV